jgi:folate-dependent phosphoribosylglycinamide formyltransferase PurN
MTPRQALIDAIGSGALPLEIALVVSNRKGAYGLERAQAAKIPTLVFPLKRVLSRLMASGHDGLWATDAALGVYKPHT